VAFAVSEQQGWFWGDMGLQVARTPTRLLLRYPGHVVVKHFVRDGVKRQRLLITNDDGDAIDLHLYFEPNGAFVHGRFWSLPDSKCRFIACSGTAPVLIEEVGQTRIWTRSGEICLCSSRITLQGAADANAADAAALGVFESTNCTKKTWSGGVTVTHLAAFEDRGTPIWW